MVVDQLKNHQKAKLTLKGIAKAVKNKVKNRKKPPLTTIRSFVINKAGFTYKKANARNNHSNKFENIEHRVNAAKVYL